MILETVNVGPMQVNCYILACAEGRGAVIIDPGDQLRKINAVLEKHKLRPAMVINTHGHYDHIGCDDKFGVPVYAHKQEVAMLTDPGLNLSASFSRAY
ncbi:MBL fold metallo-hydrolase, partial [bacterium]